jgi:hypothetical protein
MAIAGFATFGALVAALLILKPPYMGDPVPGLATPEPVIGIVQYALAAGCVASPVAAIVALLIRPSRPWRTIVIMVATVFGLVDLVVGVAAVVLLLLILESVLRGRWPYFL